MASSKTPGWDSLPKYKSPYGPKRELLQRYWDAQERGSCANRVENSGLKTGYFGAVGLFAVIYFASGIPRVQKDIMQKLPFIGNRFVHTVPASDNPF
ncbi:ubiquinol-cytochrome-c reductase complex subunit-domain-containing protein [Coniochaeta sp. 2T2.1]|nr:ubiquinol-cytochrome-c reductase complex subunit-domain-containing protein [Coniochaeta sp. 2T2.1]